MRMKIVTFNIRCDYEQDRSNNFSFRKPMILEKIKKEQPDIICFQEVLPHVAIWLKENLGDYYIIGCGRNEILGNEQTSIAYKKLKFNLLEMKVFWLSKTPNVPGSRYESQSRHPRICTVALFKDVETKKVFGIYNTHLDNENKEARELGLSQILKEIEAKESFVEAPPILVGDFNATPDSPELGLLKEYPYLIDVSTSINVTFHGFGKQEKPDKIDYIIIHEKLICNDISAWEDCINGVYLSDHYPVCAEIQFK